MAWIYLFFAGLLEIAWAIGLKYADGFTKLWPTLLTLVGLAGSMFGLGIAAKTIPIGTAYAVWVGIGAVGTAIFGVVLFAEPMPLPRLIFMILLIVSLIGMKFTVA